MRHFLALALLTSMLAGCAKKAPDSTAEATPVANSPRANLTGAGDSISPMATPMGGVTPVTGAQNVGSAGGEVGGVAKDMARKAASKAGSSSLGQSDGE